MKAPLEWNIILLLRPQGVPRWVGYDQHPFFLWLGEEFHHLHHKYHFALLGSRYSHQTPRYTSLNKSCGLIEDTVSMRVCSVTNKYALLSSRFKFRQTNTFLENETLTPEHTKVLEVGLVTGEYLIWILVQAFAEIEPIGCMTCSVDGFGPKVVRRFEFRHHGPCHIHQRLVLPLSTSFCSGV